MASNRVVSLDAKISIPIGMLISNTGNGMYLLAVSVILYRSSGASGMFASLLVYQAVAVLSMQVFASVGADRGFAQRLAVTAEIVRAVIVAVGAAGAATGHTAILVLAGVLLSLVQPFFRTSIFKIGPLIAEGKTLARYNARTSTFQQLGMFLGAAAAGWLLTLWTYFPLWINAVSYLASAFFTWIAVVPKQDEGLGGASWLRSVFRPRQAFEDWRAGMVYIARSKIILGMCAFAAVDLIYVNVINVSYPPLLKGLELSDHWLSVWDVCFAAGAIAGANIFGYLSILQGRWEVMVLAVAVQAGLAVYLVVESSYLIACFMVIIGMVNSVSVSAFSFYLQTTASKEMVGRIAGVRQLFLTMFSAVLMPWLSSGVDESLAVGRLRVAVMGLVTAACIAAMFLIFRNGYALRMADKKGL